MGRPAAITGYDHFAEASANLNSTIPPFTDSDQARALAAAGAEVVPGDADDPASLERAFAGAHGASWSPNFWEHFSTERESKQAAAMARATKAAGVAHGVWSTLEDTRLSFPLDDPRLKTLQGKYKVPHFDAKGESDAIRVMLGAAHELFDASQFVETTPLVTPTNNAYVAAVDGRRFLAAVRVDDPGAPPIQLIANWRTLLNRR